MTDEIIENAPLFFITFLVIVIVLTIYGLIGSSHSGAIANPQPITVETLSEDQASKVIIECEPSYPQNLGQITRYDFKIKTKDLALFSQDTYKNILPIFIFKSSAIAVNKIGDESVSRQVDAAKGIVIPDPQNKEQDKIGSIYSFESVKATSIDTFSPLETVLIAFLATGESNSVAASQCISLASQAFPDSSTDFKNLHNLQKFQIECQPLIKGIVSVQATNKCVTPESMSLNIVEASEISQPTGENTKITFTLKAITPVTYDKHVKIYVSCNSDETKNKYVPQGDAYIEQKNLVANTYYVSMQCDGSSDIEVKAIKNCVDADTVPGCDAATEDKDILATAVR